MSEGESFRTTIDGETRVRIGNHEGIETPFYAPEVKNWQNDLHVTLDHREALDENNPVLVPAWDWPRLRAKNDIVQRKDADDETAIGEKEIEALEKNHPLIQFFPPELFAFRGKTEILRTYLLKRDKEAKADFKSNLQDGNVEAALTGLPKFTRPFIQSNFNPILSKFGMQKDAVSNSGEDFDEIWKSIPDAHYEDFFGQIAEEAMTLPSAVVVPPVPLISRYDSDLVTALCTSNAKMAEFARAGGESRAFFHLYLHYTAFSDGKDGGRDTASRILNVLRNEVSRREYAGIAVTVYKGEEVFESSTAPRVATFFQNIATVAEDHGLPILCPRSEWLGLWATDFGIDGFSSLYNGSWTYRSGGAVENVDKYGYTMVRSESRSLKLRSENDADIEEHLSNGGIDTMDELPEEPPEPPEDFEPSDELQAKYGTSFYYRRHYGKPQKLNHVWEARLVRSANSSSAAQDHLENSENDYVKFEDES